MPYSKSHVAEWERTQQPRVWRGQIRLAFLCLFSVSTWVSFIWGLYAGMRLLLNTADRSWERPILISSILFAVSLLLSLYLSAITRCPLCHGTPFVEKRCRKHKLAFRLPGFTYRASAIIHLITRGFFRCMYCSTPYRFGRKGDTYR